MTTVTTVEVSEGGMGAIFRVKDKVTDDELALKAPLPGGRGLFYSAPLQRLHHKNTETRP